jgi:hypothetical protein
METAQRRQFFFNACRATFSTTSPNSDNHHEKLIKTHEYFSTTEGKRKTIGTKKAFA